MNDAISHGSAGDRPMRKRSTRSRPRKRTGPILALLVTLVVLGVGFWLYRQINGAKRGRPVLVVVHKGDSLSSLIPQLTSTGVVDNSDVFRLWLKLQNPGTLQLGSYRLQTQESYNSILRRLKLGPELVSLTIPPGLTISEIAARVHSQFRQDTVAAFAKAATDGRIRSVFEPANVNSLEGLLYPDTYFLSPTSSSGQIIKVMADRFVQIANQMRLAQRARALHLSPYQAIVVASMVEREAKIPGDRGKVARVIYNRMQLGMPLQIDATVLYALGNPAAALSEAQLQTPSPYNTYLHSGLPPTPISAPSKASLRAALVPSTGPWLYYVVVSPDGAEAFSSTLGAQDANIALAHARGLN